MKEEEGNVISYALTTGINWDCPEKNGIYGLYDIFLIDNSVYVMALKYYKMYLTWAPLDL